MNSLTNQEQKDLIKLMNKISFPTPLPVFEIWCKVFGTVCAEIVVLKNGDQEPEIFLTYRKDKFFDGWHIPGCVHLPTERIENTINRVLKKEIQIPPNKAIFFDWFERTSGKNKEQSSRGHEFSLVFIIKSRQKIEENDIAKFFPLRKLPKNIMHHQLPIIKKLKKTFLTV